MPKASYVFAVLYPICYGLAGVADVWVNYVQDVRGWGHCGDASLEMPFRSISSLVIDGAAVVGIFVVPTAAILLIFYRRAPLTIFTGVVLGAMYAVGAVDQVFTGDTAHCTFSKDLGNGGVMMMVSHIVLFIVGTVEFLARKAFGFLWGLRIKHD